MFIVYVLTLYSSTFYSNTAKHNANVQYTVEIDSQLYSHCITGHFRNMHLYTFLDAPDDSK